MASISALTAIRRRRRVKQTTSLQTRLDREADRLKRLASKASDAGERDRLLAKARQMEEASEIAEVLRPLRS